MFYYPFINSPSKSYDTIYIGLLQLTRVAEKQKQNHIIVTADLAIYSKAQEILWNHPSRLINKITMQLGGMHLTMAFIASISPIFGDGGLANVLRQNIELCVRLFDNKNVSALYKLNKHNI